MPTDTESIVAASTHAAAHVNDGTYGTFGGAPDDVSRGASCIEPGDREIVVPKDAPCYVNDSSRLVQEAFSDTDVIDAEDFEYTPLLALEPTYLATLRMYKTVLGPGRTVGSSFWGPSCARSMEFGGGAPGGKASDAARAVRTDQRSRRSSISVDP